MTNMPVQDKAADFSLPWRDGVVGNCTHGTPSALFVGAHPDDIEIACGGTVAKLSDLGWTTWVWVLTDESDAELAHIRRKETINSAAMCGVDPRRVLFLGASDAALECNGSTVAAMRRLATEHQCDPDVIFTHSRADSHNDHRAAHDVVLSSFRQKTVLCFAVINSLVESHFVPSIFIDVAPYANIKRLALASHRTQQHRIDLASIERFSAAYYGQSESNWSEPFEMLVQHGAGSSKHLARALNSSVFNTFWSRLMGSQQLIALYSSMSMSRHCKPAAGNSERQGCDLLIESFVRRWHGKFPLSHMPADKAGARTILASSTCLLAGGASTNPLTASVFNQLDGVRFVTCAADHDDGAPTIIDRRNGNVVTAQHRGSGRDKEILVDYGILTVMNNPFDADKFLIGCMGMHEFGSLACFHAIADPRLIRGLPMKRNFQILVRIEVASQQIDLMEETLHLMR